MSWWAVCPGSGGMVCVYLRLYNDHLNTGFFIYSYIHGLRKCYCLLFTDKLELLQESVRKGQLQPAGTNAAGLFL